MNVRKKYNIITTTSASADDLRENKTAYIKNNGDVEKISGTIINYSGLLIFRDNPIISLEDSTLNITALKDATSYDIYSNGVLIRSTSVLKVNLATLLTEEGTYNIYVIAKGTGYKDSEKSNVVTFKVLPTKGSLINLDMTGSGIASQYRVLKVNETVVEVLGMTDLQTSFAYNTTSKTGSFDKGTIGQLYAGSDLDTYLNTTWYNTLSATAKAALVQKSIIQKMYSQQDGGTSTSATYSGTYGTGSTKYYLTLSDQKTVGNRYVYALGVEDVVEYVSNLTMYTVNMMYWNTIAAQHNTCIWLNSAYAGLYNNPSDRAFSVSGDNGQLHSYRPVTSTDDVDRVRPAFQIDLSKINWSKVS